MINFELVQRWAKFCKQPDAFKTTGALTKMITNPENVLESVEADCCLGRYCRMRATEGVSIRVKLDYNNSHSITWNGERLLLSPSLAEELGITQQGSLTVCGRLIVEEYFGLNVTKFDLTGINDDITTSDKTLFRMGCLLEWLATEEYLFNRKCFNTSADL